jgi:periplasmic protein TonB
MKHLLTLTFIIFSFSVFAQIDTIGQKPKPPSLRHKLPKPPKEKIDNYEIDVYEEMPRFPGCEDIEGSSLDKKACADEKMLAFIHDNICYPDSARENGIEGTVVISFIVEKDGSITNAKIIRDLGAGCGEEALRIVNMLPNFEAAKLNGKPVRCQFNLPIRFRLE